jgi:hypothetical protein
LAVNGDRGAPTDGVPRYRVEHRAPNLATLIIGFADTPRECRSLVAVAAGRLLRERVDGELVVVDQATETDLTSRPVWGES